MSIYNINSIDAQVAYDFVRREIQLEDKEVYTVSLEYFLQDNVRVYGCYLKDTNKLVGIGCLSKYSYDEEDGYPQKLGYSRQQTSSLLRIEASFVSPMYRGRGIQGELLRYREAVARYDSYKYLCVSMHKENKANQKAVCKEGFLLGFEGYVEENKYRLIYHKVL